MRALHLDGAVQDMCDVTFFEFLKLVRDDLLTIDALPSRYHLYFPLKSLFITPPTPVCGIGLAGLKTGGHEKGGCDGHGRLFINVFKNLTGLRVGLTVQLLCG